MNKRELVKMLGVGAAGVALAPLGARAGKSPARVVRNYAWINLDKERSADEWRRNLAAWREAGLTGIILEIYNGRAAYYDSVRLPVAYDRLGLILPAAREAGLEVHAWMWMMPCMLDAVMRKHPDWYNVNARGERALEKPAYVDYYKFLDPANPEVREWVSDNVRELAAIDGVDAVHLDYIRHPDAILPRQLWAKYGVDQSVVLPDYDYGYTPYARADFKKKHGTDPMKIAVDDALRQAWTRYRWDAVTGLVNDHLVPVARAAGKKISAAVFPGPTLARQMVYQNWGEWKLDSFHPMLYHGYYRAEAPWIGEQTAEGVKTVDAPIYSGLFAPDVVADGLRPLVKAALGAGAAGVTLYHADAMSPEMWRAFSETARA